MPSCAVEELAPARTFAPSGSLTHTGNGRPGAAGGGLEARKPPAEEAGGRLEDERVEGADLGNEISTSSNEGEGKLQQHLRSSCRSRDRPIELLSKGRLVAELLSPPRDDRDVRQAERPGDVLEKGALAGVGLQQGEPDMRHLDCQRDRRQATAATDVDHPGDAAPGGLDQDAGIIDQRLDFLERPCPGEVDGSVPLEEEVRVLLNFWAHNLTILTCRSTGSLA